jgi:hypothetical protein
VLLRPIIAASVAGTTARAPWHWHASSNICRQSLELARGHQPCTTTIALQYTINSHFSDDSSPCLAGALAVQLQGSYETRTSLVEEFIRVGLKNHYDITLSKITFKFLRVLMD